MRTRKNLRGARALAVLALAGALVGGCGDYLSGPELTTDPNNPTAAPIDQLFYSVQLRQFSGHEGDLARGASMFVQQMAGTDRQFIARDLYDFAEDEFDYYFSRIYTGGGLIDLRKVETAASERNDKLYLGIAQVWEAFLMGMAASVWGDIPYSEAVNPAIRTPKLDPQQDVYAAVQTLLDDAIANLANPPAPGPGDFDLVFGGDGAAWTEVAHTLKARFYMHWVEAQRAGGAAAQAAQVACSGDCIQKASAQAKLGISSPAHDLTTIHSAVTGEQNLWFQFMSIQRQGYMSAGKALVDLLTARGDPRLARYFAPTKGGPIVGAPVGSSVVQSQLNPATRGAAAFDQPLVTYEETQLILAETSWYLNDFGAALGYLNTARASAGVPALSGVTGAALLQEIGTEEYVSEFQNIEAWNDYKRLCVPQLTPPQGRSEILGRIFYGFSERNANPNIPPPAQQPARNTNDPNPC
jgi:hypothetical protein